MKSLNVHEKEADLYSGLNQVAKFNAVVLFGSTFAKNIPVGELNQSMNLYGDVYNRSFTDLSVFDAESLLDRCIFPLSPKKIILQLGETDLERGFMTIPKILDQYVQIICKIRAFDKHCKIVIASIGSSVPNLFPATFNRELEKMASRCKCQFVDLASAFTESNPTICAFRKMRTFLLDRVGFYDAMNA
ncbi:MAG: SGNH/GDSL hydrolase family protein [Eubacteriales bacterium]